MQWILSRAIAGTSKAHPNPHLAVKSTLARSASLLCILLKMLPASATEPHLGIDRSGDGGSAPRAPDVTDLPIIEVPASRNASPCLALLLTGDGGWAELDQGVTQRLAESGVPVVGLNSLKYFWTPRTPESAARDVERVLGHYLETWEKTEVLLLGYSFGADVLPFIVNRLPADLHARVRSITLVGLAHDATWEVHVTDWLPELKPVGTPIAPEIARLPSIPLLCLYGEGERSLCPELPRERATAVLIGKGHHLGGDYGMIADRILEFSRSNKRP